MCSVGDIALNPSLCTVGKRDLLNFVYIGAIQVLRNADGGVRFSGKKRYEGVRFNVISVTRGWVGVQFPEKKRYVTLEWPHRFQAINALIFKT